MAISSSNASISSEAICRLIVLGRARRESGSASTRRIVFVADFSVCRASGNWDGVRELKRKIKRQLYLRWYCAWALGRTLNSQREKEIPLKWDQAVNLISQKWGSSAEVSPLHNLHVEHLSEIKIKERSRIRDPVPPTPTTELYRFVTDIVGWPFDQPLH